MKFSITFCVVVCSLAIVPALADPPAPDPTVPTMHAEARVVEVDVVVMDSHGKAVTGLSKADFTLMDNGKPRGIDIFSVSSGQPVAVSRRAPPSPALPPNVFSNRNEGAVEAPAHATVIVLDASPASARNEMGAFAAARAQAMGRVRSMMPDEQIAVFVIAKQQGLFVLQDYTNDRELLLQKLRDYTPLGLQIELSPWVTFEPMTAEYTESGLPTQGKTAAPSTTESPRRDPNVVPARETEYRIDTSVRENRLSLQAVAERLALLPGRKNIFWATTGFPPLLAHTPGWEHTIAALNDANIAVNSGGCSNSLREITAKTGGSANCPELAGAAAVTEGSRTTYALGFYLAETERNNVDHALKVRVDRPNVQLFYRQSYYAGESPKTLQEKKPGLESALLNPVNATGVGITARVETVPGSPRGTAVVHLNLDPATVTLKEKPGGWLGEVEEIFVEMNAGGDTLGKISDKKEFEIPDGDRAGYESQGVGWPMSIPLMEGAAKIAVVVRDTKTGKIGSLTVPVTEGSAR